MTGAPYEIVDHHLIENEEEMFKKLQISNREQFIMCASIGANEGEEDEDNINETNKNIKKLGLISNHAYSLIGIHELDTSEGKV